GAFGYRVSQRALTVVGGVQVDQRGPAGGVAHALHQLAQVRPSRGDQEVPGVAQVVKMNATQACSGQRGQPDAAPEGAVPQRLAVSGERQRVRFGRGEAREVRTHVRQDHLRNDDDAPARVRLGRPEVQRLAVDLNELTDNTDSASL